MNKKSNQNNKASNKRIDSILPLIILFVLIAPFFIYLCSMKEIWFCDEVYSYESANSGIWFYENPMDNSGEWLSGQVITDYLTKGAKTFNFIEIEKYLYTDHVPLYFLIFRVVSLINYGNLTKWTGLSINIVCYLFSAFFLYDFFKKVTKHNYISAVSVAMIMIHPMILSEATMIRMYMMLTFETLLFLHLAREKFFMDKKKGLMVLKSFLLVAVTSAGMLTHYYFWIFVAVYSFVFCIYLLISKKFKPLITYIITMIFAPGFVTLGFPLVWKRTLFAKNSDTPTMSAITSTIDRFKNTARFKEISLMIINEFFPGFGLNNKVIAFIILFSVTVLVLAIVALICSLYLTKHKEEEEKHIPFIIVITMLIYIFAVGFTSVSLSIRYLRNPIIIGFAALVSMIIALAVPKKGNFKVVSIIALVIFSLFFSFNVYMSSKRDNIEWLRARDVKDEKNVLNTINKKTVVVFSDTTDFKFHCSFYDFRKAGNLIRVDSNTPYITSDCFESEDEIIVYCYRENNINDYCRFIENSSNRTVISNTYVGPSCYMNVYSLKLSE